MARVATDAPIDVQQVAVASQGTGIIWRCPRSLSTLSRIERRLRNSILSRSRAVVLRRLWRRIDASMPSQLFSHPRRHGRRVSIDSDRHPAHSVTLPLQQRQSARGNSRRSKVLWCGWRDGELVAVMHNISRGYISTRHPKPAASACNIDYAGP
jgi:hypothetical protein